jgi:eukaryotic-like serine/threonine-protein kinase
LDLPSAAFRLEKLIPWTGKLHMDLWTEYEGTTIDGSFPLTKLLRPEGRSALFYTTNGNRVPRLIRLIESHFDADEILGRWRGVAALNNPHLLKLENFGQVELDATSVVYAVMEPVDTNLGEVVSQQRLTQPEARQLASSLTSALQALHSHGFVHEHVEPTSVLAVGDVVKLRSDCIRESPEGEGGRELKTRDVHDLAVVLLQALRQTSRLETTTREPLPAPFDRIVELGMSGAWGLTEIAAALGREQAPRRIAPPRAAPPPELKPVETAQVKTAQVETAAPAKGNAVYTEDPAYEDPAYSDGWGAGWLVGIALALILVLWVGWHFLHGKPEHLATARQEASIPTPGAARTGPAVASAPAAPAKARAAQKNDAMTAGKQWRVIAYTYNRQEQAQQKAEAVAQKHPELRAAVFSPSGHAPYLVAIGGALSRDEAFALVKKARSLGLPTDTYAQNYKGKGD